MTKSLVLFKRVLSLLVCVGICVSFCFFASVSTDAAAAFSMSASAVADNKFTLTVTIPEASWNTFLFLISYDHNVVQASDATHSAGAMVMSNSAAGNTTGTYKVNGIAVMPVASASTLTIPFTVKDPSVPSVTISLSVSDFAAGATQIENTAPAPVTVTLGTVATEPQQPTETTTPTVDQPPVVDTTTNTTTSTKTSTKTSSKNTSTKTDTESDVTDTESLTDTETNFPISDSATGTETDVTDVTDTTDSIATESTLVSLAPQEENPPVSTSMIALISIGIAVVFCGVLTVFGLLRHKKED